MTDPARIQRIAAAVHECAVSWEPGARLIGNVTADEIRELAEAASQMAGEPDEPASQAVAPVEPVAVVWNEDPEYTPTVQAKTGSLTLSVWPAESPEDIIGWVWDVTFGEQLIARSGIRGIQSSRDAAKAAAIAAARAWRDSIRL